MELELANSKLKIRGNIKSVRDFQSIKTELDGLIGEHKHITLDIVDSISMTSSVIGYLVKIIHKDGVSLSMNVGDERLAKLLDELGLSQEFNVKKV